jgi:site-specific recombinase XerD
MWFRPNAKTTQYPMLLTNTAGWAGNTFQLGILASYRLNERMSISSGLILQNFSGNIFVNNLNSNLTNQYFQFPLKFNVKSPIFKELNEANEKNDVQRVSEILSNLEKGILSTIKGDRLTDIDKLRATIERLRVKVKTIETQIVTIKQSEAFIIINKLNDWDDYFNITKEKLQRELEELRLEVSA